MSENGGVTAGYVDAEISGLRAEMEREVGRLERQISRLEEEMANLAREVVAAIHAQTEALSDQIGQQTVAMVGGVTAATLMIERTKEQIESDFKETRNKLDLQTETELQVEVGKKVAEAAAARGKLDAFRADINNRFQKSVQLIYLNRVLYNTHFQKIFDEYHNKIRTIGEHIFKIRDVDLAPAVHAAQVAPQEIHGLPIEVDLYRLKVRSENLDESLTLLKSSRLDDVLTSTQRLDALVGNKYAAKLAERPNEAVVSGISVQSTIGAELLVAAEAQPVSEGAVNLRSAQGELSAYGSAVAKSKARAGLASRKRRSATNEEVVSLAQAAARLQQRNLISAEAYVMFEDFLGQDVLRIVE